MKRFKEFVNELSIETWAKSDVSDLKAQLSDIEGKLDLLEDGPARARLNKKRLLILQVLNHKGHVQGQAT